VRSLDDLPKGTGLTLIESLTRGMGGELRLKASDTMTFELTVPLSGDGCFDTDDEAAAGD
jgi:two-component sensor histidine kinase